MSGQHKLFAKALRDPKVLGADLGDLGDVRALLGEYGRNLSDAEVEVLRDQARHIAEAFSNTWLKRRRALAPTTAPLDNSGDGTAVPPNP